MEAQHLSAGSSEYQKDERRVASGKVSSELDLENVYRNSREGVALVVDVTSAHHTAQPHLLQL